MSEHLRNVWRRGGTGIGAWITSREPLLAESAALAGYDYVCVDMQHGLMSFDHAVAMLSAMARTETTPLVRVPWNEPGIIGRALDAGAYGVVIPMVNTPEQAEAAVRACFYAPKGARSIGPTGHSARIARESYFSTANERVLCIPMIETREAIERLDDILAVPGIDALYVGPADLSIAHGLPPGNDQVDERWNTALARVVDRCDAHGVVPGIHGTAELVAKRASMGFRMVTAAADLSSAVAGMAADLATARKALVA